MMLGPVTPVVGIIDYGAGNLRSIENAFEHLGARVVHVRTAGDMDPATHLLLPGVGAFGFCAERLRASTLVPAVERWVFDDRKPLLGICVGMQLLADDSDELGLQSGLGWMGGPVRRLHSDDPAVRIPHVGWNTALFKEDFGDFSAGDEADFYFDHSFAYRKPRQANALASCWHGEPFNAALRRDNLVAAQFHPEKSQAAGMRFLRGFLAM